MASLSSPFVACDNLSRRLESVKLNREKCALLLLCLNRVRNFYCPNVGDSAKREFQEAVERAQHLFDESSDRKWLLKAVELWECSEHFVELFVDLFWSAQIMAFIPEEVHEFTREKEKLLNDRAVLLQTANHIDKSTLSNRIKRLLNSGSPEERQLAHLLKDRFENQSSWYPPILTSFYFYFNSKFGSKTISSSKRGQDAVVLSFKWVYGKDFAVKVRHPDAGCVKSFKHEFDVLDNHRSPYIVGVVGYWELEAGLARWYPWHHLVTLCPFLLMEAMDWNLEELITRYRESRGGEGFSALETIKLMLPISRALRFLHAKDVAHRDVKLKNIMCSNIASGQLDNFIVKLIDFGEAMDISEFSFGHKHGRAGTNGFMGPEMFTPEGSTDLKRADVFSFAMVFVELLMWRWTCSEEAGVQPGKGVQDWLNLGKRPTLPDDLPDYVGFIVKSCWSVDPNMRPTFDDICLMLQNAKLLILDPNFGEGEDPFVYWDATFVKRDRTGMQHS
ncbi:hypothetical protein KC19_5G177100 [Ceratodon purpureus]|uniref:Protein kinase domain-containing protein n=1 Tax=Ceratodon purpureus TaxID=3225 RepID=A0A8T0I3X8_CERPU|nr:hypothetical protein KC19_5G177100 [Ceratodon purpureus]